jgi:hypothetical protein
LCSDHELVTKHQSVIGVPVVAEKGIGPEKERHDEKSVTVRE